MLRGFVFMFLARTGLLRIVSRLMLDKRVPLRAKLIIPAAIIYLIFPFDIVPDLIPFAGWIDDLLAILVSTAVFLGSVPREVLSEHFGGLTPKDKSRPDGKVIDGSYRVVKED